MRNAAAKAREIESDVYLPFGRHVTDTVISLSTRALITVIRIDGTSFETAEAADLNDIFMQNSTSRYAISPTTGWRYGPISSVARHRITRAALSARHFRPRWMRNIANGFGAQRCFATTSI